ncbi:MAG: hypothetical protein D9V47_06905 [Clostridia bacterium]|nr:MAG: hypothetical protein D9V47_06905 [Clostridia bacterium]
MRSGFWTLTGREFSAAWIKGVVCLAIALATAISIPLLFDWLAGASLPGLPATAERALAAQVADYHLYLWANWYGKNLLQFMLVFALIFGAPALAGEAASGSMGFTLSLPFARRQVLGAKFLAGAIWLAMIALISTLALPLTSDLVGKPVSLALLLRGLPGTLAGAFLAYAIAMALSAVTNDMVKAGVVAAGILVLLAVPGLIPGGSPYSFLTYMAAAGPLVPPSWVWWGTLAVSLAIMPVYLLARWLFLRRDY